MKLSNISCTYALKKSLAILSLRSFPYMLWCVPPLHSFLAPFLWWHSGASYHPQGRWQPLTNPLQRFHWECGITSQFLQCRSHCKYNLKQHSLVWFWEKNDKRHVSYIFTSKNSKIIIFDPGKDAWTLTLCYWLIRSTPKKVWTYSNWFISFSRANEVFVPRIWNQNCPGESTLAM